MKRKSLKNRFRTILILSGAILLGLLFLVVGLGFAEVNNVLHPPRLAKLSARPHYGKLCTMQPDRLQPLDEKSPDFRCDFLDRTIF
jgi:hypothetical protein